MRPAASHVLAQGRAWHTGTVVGGSVHGNSDILLIFGGESIKDGKDGVGKRQARQYLHSLTRRIVEKPGAVTMS